MGIEAPGQAASPSGRGDPGRKRAESALRKHVDNLRIINDLAVELAAAPSEEACDQLLANRLLELTGAVITAVSHFDPETHRVWVGAVSAQQGVAETVEEMLGQHPAGLSFDLPGEFAPSEPGSAAAELDGLGTVFYGQMPPEVVAALEQRLGLGRVYGLVLRCGRVVIGYASAMMALEAPEPDIEILRAFANLAASAIWQRRSEPGGGGGS